MLPASFLIEESSAWPAHLYQHLLLGGEAVLPGEAHFPRQQIAPPSVDQGLQAHPDIPGPRAHTPAG